MRLSRTAYWIIGGAIALAGAFGARIVAEAYPAHQIAIWFVGGAIIFFGLAVLSKGSQVRVDKNDKD
jgi:hypothetical protein